MSVTVYVKRVGAHLVPSTEQDEEVLRETIHYGEDVKAEITHPRNPHFHRFYWSLLKVVSDNLETLDTPDKLHLYLKIATGQIEHTIIDPESGKTYLTPKSTSFSAMDEAAFRKYVNGALEVINRIWNGEVDPNELIQQANILSGVNFDELGKKPKKNH